MGLPSPAALPALRCSGPAAQPHAAVESLLARWGPTHGGVTLTSLCAARMPAGAGGNQADLAHGPQGGDQPRLLVAELPQLAGPGIPAAAGEVAQEGRQHCAQLPACTPHAGQLMLLTGWRCTRLSWQRARQPGERWAPCVGHQGQRRQRTRVPHSRLHARTRTSRGAAPCAVATLKGRSAVPPHSADAMSASTAGTRPLHATLDHAPGLSAAC